MATAEFTEADLTDAIRDAIAAQPDLEAAGPKALMTAVQAADARFGDVGKHKMKKVLDKVKATLREEQEIAKREAAAPKVGTMTDCPGRHGLTRFTTTHSNFCCDTCRCYQQIGTWMWGCRVCDWDVCEGRCHPSPADAVTLGNLRQGLGNLEERVEDLQQEAPSDLKTKLALVEAEVHKLEKKLDNATARDLADASPLQMSEEEARTDKKALLKRTEVLLAKIEGIFGNLSQEVS